MNNKSCQILADWNDVKDVENMNECKCPDNAVGKFEIENKPRGTFKKWLCKKHKKRFNIIKKIE